MNKLAIYVEGLTELKFVDKLIKEIANREEIVIQKQEIRGQGNKKVIKLLNAIKPSTTQKYFVQIIDCGGETLVKPRIAEDHESLDKAGFNKIIGLRDVRPNYTAHEIPKLLIGLKYGIKTSRIPVDFVLAQMETEAWFLAEYNHYLKIHPSLTLDNVIHNLGFDPSNEDMTLRTNPTDDLQNVYGLANKKYRKGRPKTPNSLNYEFIYAHLTEKISSLKQLTDGIDHFLSLP